MAKTVSFDFKNVAGMASAEDIAAIKEEVVAAKSTLVNKTGEGNDFLGWIDLPVDYDKEEFARIKCNVRVGNFLDIFICSMPHCFRRDRNHFPCIYKDLHE